jgi:hypothetical protein
MKTMVLFTPITIVMLMGSNETLFARFSMPGGIITMTSLALEKVEDDVVDLELVGLVALAEVVVV